MKDQEGGTVLIVDDDVALTEVYAAWLEDHYPVETATTGEEALESLESHIAVVLLDRRMPGLPGEAVLEAVREQGIDCRVAMVSGVRPDTDIVDLGFDDYLVKPVTGDDLRELVGQLLERQSYDDRIQRYFSLASKRAALETEVDRAARTGHLEEAIQTIDRRLESVQAEMSKVVDSFGVDDLRVAFRDLTEANDD